MVKHLSTVALCILVVIYATICTAETENTSPTGNELIPLRGSNSYIRISNLLPDAELNDILQYNGTSFVAQGYINGLIDDAAGNGDTTSVWSADKIYNEFSNTNANFCTWSDTNPDPTTMDNGQCIISRQDGNTYRRDSNGLGYQVTAGTYTLF